MSESVELSGLLQVLRLFENTNGISVKHASFHTEDGTQKTFEDCEISSVVEFIESLDRPCYVVAKLDLKSGISFDFVAGTADGFTVHNF
jgi:hypothetical protein